MKKNALIIRHADRDKIPNGEFGGEIMLNKKGEKNALVFGGKFKKQSINKIFTSPIGRCVQTAELIKKGAEQNVEIISTEILGAPGVFVHNEKLAGKFFVEANLETIYNMIINDISIPGMRDLKTACQMLEKFVTENTDENKLTIYVTHDYFIAFLEYYYYKKTYENKILVDFLGGIKF